MKNALYKSIALHLVVLILFLVDIPVFWRRDLTINQVPIIVDLNNVKLSDMTNLPPKAKRGAEEKQASKIKRKIEKNYTKDEPSAEPEVKSKPEEAKEETPPAKQEKVEKPKQDFLVAPQPKKPKVPVKKQEAKPAPKPKPKPKPKLKPITNYGYELKDSNNKSLKEIASLYFISPNELLGMIQRRIPSARIADVDSKLDLIQISICRRIFEELYYVNKDKIDR